MATFAVYDRWFDKNGNPVPPEKRRNLRYEARFYDPFKPGDRNKWFADKQKKAAENFIADKRAAYNAGLSVDEKSGDALIKDYAPLWLNTLTLEDNSHRKYEGVVRNHIIPKLGHITLRQARSSTIKEWVKYLSKELGLARKTVLDSYRILASMFATAVHDRAIPVTPCVGVRMPDSDGKPESRQWIPTPEQVAQLIENIPDRYRLAVVLAAGCALRMGEIEGLCVEDIDFLRRTIRVRKQLTHPKGQGPRFSVTKTGTSARTVTDVPQDVLDAASQHIAAGYARAMTIPDYTAKVKPGKEAPRRDVRLLFTTPEQAKGLRSRTPGAAFGGRPLTASTWSRIWKPALVGIEGLPTAEDDGEEFTMHNLRHYVVSLLFEAGASPIRIQKLLGHKKLSTTMDVYGHLMRDDDNTVRTAIEAAFAAGRAARKVG